MATFPSTSASLTRRGSVLVQGMVGSVTCVAAHPKLPRLVILCDSGDVHLWDYNLKARNVSKKTDTCSMGVGVALPTLDYALTANSF